MWLIALLPFLAQAIAILLDEWIFHIKRGLPRWERIGHPLDTLTVLACLGFVLFVPYSPFALKGYIGLSLFSSLFVTKDEFVHKHFCPWREQWLHALLFTLHPTTLAMAGLIWPIIHGAETAPWLSSWLDHPVELSIFLKGQMGLMSLFCLYQIIYWNFIWKGEVLDQ